MDDRHGDEDGTAAGLPAQPELKRNMAALMRRGGIGSIGKLRAQMVASGIKIGTGALVKAINGEAGNRIETLMKIAEFFDVTADQLLQADLGQEQEFAGPPSPGRRFDALDATDQRFLENLQVIKLDPSQLEEVMEFVANKAAKLRALQQLIEEQVLAKHGIRSTPAKHAADAKKTEIARAALDVTEQLRQRSLLDDDGTPGGGKRH